MSKCTHSKDGSNWPRCISDVCVCCLFAGREYRGRQIYTGDHTSPHSRTLASHNSHLSIRLCVDLWCQMSHLLLLFDSLAPSLPLSRPPRFASLPRSPDKTSSIRVSFSNSPQNQFILFVIFVSFHFDFCFIRWHVYFFFAFNLKVFFSHRTSVENDWYRTGTHKCGLCAFARSSCRCQNPNVSLSRTLQCVVRTMLLVDRLW